MSSDQLTRGTGRPGATIPTGRPPSAPDPRRQPRQLPSLRFRRIRALALLLVLVLLVWACVRLIAGAISAGDAGDGPQAWSPPTSESASAALAAAIAARTQGIEGDVAVATLDLDTKVSATYGPEKAFATASIVKVDILAALLLKENGKLSASQRATAKRMIQLSDNNAATALWKQIGGTEGLAEANRRMGLTGTTPGTQLRWGLTTTTVGDQLRLLSVIFTADSPLDADSRDYIRSLMGDVADDQDWGVPVADDPGGAGSFVKNGWLRHGGGWIVNSIGEVEHGGHRVLVVALSADRTARDAGIDALEGIVADAVVATTGR